MREESGPRGLLIGAMVLLALGWIGHGLNVVGSGGVPARPVGQTTLYVPDERVKIIDAHLEDRRLTLTLRGLRTDDSIGQESVSLDLGPDLATYVVEIPDFANTQSISLELADGVDGPLLVSSSVPIVGDTEILDLAFWTEGLLDREDEESLSRARVELSAALEGTESTTDLERVAALADWAYAEIGGAWGDPSPAARQMTGLQLMDAARRGEEELNCGPASKVFASYAVLAGIPTRLVALMGDRGDIPIARHTVAEAWLEDEGRWVVVDLVSGVRYYESLQQEPLNMQEVLDVWDVSGEAGLNPILVTGSEPTDPYFALRRHVSPEVLFFYQRPVHHLGAPYEKLMAAVLSPKLARSRNPSRLRGLEALRLFSNAALLLSGFLLVWWGLGLRQRKRGV